MPVPAGPVKLNLGGGIEVADGWINVDGGIHGLLASAPPPFVRFAYRHTHTVRRIVEEDEYVARIKSHRFVFHDLTVGLPFDTGSVDYVFSSHVMEHLSREDGRALLREMFRVLRPGGQARITVPDLEKAIGHYHRGDREEALRYFFPEAGGGALDVHRTMYDFHLLEAAMAAAGFRDVARCAYRQGRVPDLLALDNRPEETLFVEGEKTGD